MAMLVVMHRGMVVDVVVVVPVVVLVIVMLMRRAPRRKGAAPGALVVAAMIVPEAEKLARDQPEAEQRHERVGHDADPVGGVAHRRRW